MAGNGEAASREDGATELNLGVKLRYAREAQKLSIEDIAAELRVGGPALLALEECRFDAVGPPVFAKGYLKQYAALLGLDVADILAEYERTVGGERYDIAPSKSIKLRDERQIAVWLVAAVMLVVLTVLLLIWWFRQPGQLWGPAETEQSAAARAASAPAPALTTRDSEPAAESERPLAGIAAAPPPEPVAQEPANDAPPPSSEVQSDSARTPEAASDDLSIEPETAPRADAVADAVADPVAPGAAPASVSAADRIAEAVPAPQEQPSEARESDQAREIESIASPVVAAAESEPSSGPSVEVVFVEDSWAEIVAADSGERLFYRLGEAGTSQRFSGDEALSFFFGNARGVEIRLDGRQVAIPASARRGDLAQFDLSDIRD